MNILQIIVLALIQGAAELLPVSSSAHVIVAEKWMGLDPGAPEMTFLLVMLHTGTMFAVLFYFWDRWKKLLVNQKGTVRGEHFYFVKMIVIASALTGVLGLGLKWGIENIVLMQWLGHEKGEIEHLFRSLPLIATSLTVVGTLILVASQFEKSARNSRLTVSSAAWIGIVQGLCLPFRGFSRSGATISTAFFCGINRKLAEEFSFALAVVVTPPVILLQTKRLLKAAESGLGAASNPIHLFLPGLLGMGFAFLSGLVALKFLSNSLEKGQWKYFGYYCYGFSAVVLATQWMKG
ncbi:MAG: undecaprenyl-diphosphate phosphatase [Bdellovibrionota bacterium]